MHSVGNRNYTLFACLLWGFLGGAPGFADDGQHTAPSPLLVLPEPSTTLPMLDTVLRDSSLSLPKGDTSKGRQLLLAQVKQARSQLLGKSAREGALHHLRAYLDALVRYSYLLADDLAANPKQAALDSEAKTLVQVRQQIKHIAAVLFRRSQDPYEKSSSLFHAASIDFLEPTRRHKAVQLFSKLSGNRYLKENQLRMVRLALSLHFAQDDKIEKRQEAQGNLERLYSQLPRRAATLAHLSLASSLSQQASAPAGSYRQHLMVVSRLCQQLNPYEKSAVARTMIGVWKAAPDFSDNWQTLPFASDCFLHDTAMRAVIERQALAAWRQGNLDAARERYALVVRYTKGEDDRRRLGRRLVKILGMIYERDKDPGAYQQYLIAAELKNRGSNYGRQLQALHAKLVLQEIHRSRELKEPLKVKLAVTVDRYLTTQSYDRRGQLIKHELADAYMQEADYRSAESLYSELSREPLAEEAKKAILRKQIAAQTHLAAWQLDNPWKALAVAGNKSEREQLLRLYYNLMQAEGTLVWQLSTQIGLLELALDRKGKAFFLWENALKAFPREAEGEKILALMLRSCESDQRWEQLEEYAYLGLDLHITPRHQGQELSLRDKLEMALYEQSKAGIASKHYELAIKKLRVLENTYDESSRYSEYLYSLATSYRENQEYEQALASFAKLLKLNPAQPFYKAALVDAAAMYEGRADPLAAAALYEQYATTFPDDKELNKIRYRLASIYQSMSQFAKAKTTYQSIDLTALSTDERQQLSEDLFKIDQKMGGDRAVVELAEQILAQSDGSKPAATLKARSIAVLARAAYDANKPDKLQKLEKFLPQSELDDSALTDSLSLIWYLSAKLASEAVISNFKKILTANEHEALVFLESSYKQAKDRYLAVCQLKDSAYCVPSVQELVAVNGKLQGFVEDMGQRQQTEVIVGHSPAGDVSPSAAKASYASIREKFLRYLDDDLRVLKERTLSLLAGGHTHPRTTRHILWQNGRDYHAPVHGEAYPGFLQISQEYMQVRNIRQGG